ncbi:MAG: tRNA (guanosine(37)-N1)-methyltransferase TrmD [Holosporales bacterium]|jgi:tRNA (guanine37-N1)-methyltransferase|nr:tRNA (guanosine(37)-N1)-methyltransferase TrmD [Holosporales bacterium]
MWKVNVLTLFPEIFPGPLACSLSGKGLKNGIWELSTTQIRNFALDKHHTVDDTCYGYNAGMIMKPDVIDSALQYAVDNFKAEAQIVYMTPKGRPLTQKMVHIFTESPGLIILCGRYEGIDERVIEYWGKRGLQEVSIGDYILSGGEIGAITLIDACVRLLPNIVHNEESLVYESFESGLLEFPQYTRPYNWRETTVPDVLLSGNHKEITKWQKSEAERETKKRRPDLWQIYTGAPKECRS